MSTSFDVEGYEQLRRKLLELGTNGRRIENKAIREGGQILFNTMKEEMPKSTIDHLHAVDDLQISGIKRTDGIPHVVVSPGKETAWRVKFVLFGTVKMPPNDFRGRAITKSRGQVKNAMKAVIQKGLGL
nr:HK97-gp10 family putative phage morphogenesis protein [Fredinandcohnia onubensis]